MPYTDWKALLTSLPTLEISNNLDKKRGTDGEKTERPSMEINKRHHTILEFKATTNTMEEEIKRSEKEAHGLPSPIN